MHSFARQPVSLLNCWKILPSICLLPSTGCQMAINFIYVSSFKLIKMEQRETCTHPFDHMCSFMPTLQASLPGQLMCCWLVGSVTPTHRLGPHPTPARAALGPRCQSLTSIVVFAVTTGGFHGCVTARSSPAQLADAVPAIQVQGTSSIAIAQARAALCKAKHTASRSDRLQPPAVTHTHARPACSESALTPPAG